jgi:hypothetical protein
MRQPSDQMSDLDSYAFSCMSSGDIIRRPNIGVCVSEGF